jgi:hypothetical protein
MNYIYISAHCVTCDGVIILLITIMMMILILYTYVFNHFAQEGIQNTYLFHGLHVKCYSSTCVLSHSLDVAYE